MNWRRALALGLAFAVALPLVAAAQMGGGGGRSGRGGGKQPMPDPSSSPRTSDPAAYDAIDLFSRLCVSTRGNRAVAIGIVGDGDSAIEKMDDALLRGMENGQTGGIGWIIRMPLGEKLLLEFPPGGGCIVRIPRVNPRQLELGFQTLMDQYSASGQFKIHRDGDQVKAVDAPVRGSDQPKDERSKIEKLKFHLVSYTMSLPDTGNRAELGMAVTESQAVSIQATLSFEIPTGKP